MQKPKQGDYNPYYEGYIGLVAEDDVIGQLQRQESELLSLYGALSEEQGACRYGEGKWSLKELFGHVIDTERIMTYRLLRIARGDETPLPGFDQDAFIGNSDFNRRSIAELTEEFRAVRAAAVALIRSLREEELLRAGNANNHRTTAAALVYITAGHAIHHTNIVRDRYMPGLKM